MTGEYYPQLILGTGIAMDTSSMIDDSAIQYVTFHIAEIHEELLKDCLILLFEDPHNDDLYLSIKQRYEEFKRTESENS